MQRGLCWFAVSLAALMVSGCVNWLGTPDTAPVPGLDTPPPVEEDYPGWTVVGRDVTVSKAMTPVQGGQTRQEDAAVMTSPQGDMTLLITYMRSGADTGEIAAKSWSTLDTMFRDGGWLEPQTQSLYQQVMLDYPEWLVLGAYDVDPGPGETRRVNVGFYQETRVGSSGAYLNSWIRGERVYAMDASWNWSKVADDSNSDSCWDVLVPVD